MLQRIRQDKIVKYLAENDFLTVEKAMELFPASPATIRRDFTYLADNNIVTKVHGGIKKLDFDHDTLPYAIRENRYSSEKATLAKKAVELISPEDVIFIDGGSTTAQMGYFLQNIDLRIISNSLKLANIIEERHPFNSALEFYMTGGFLYRKSGILLGPKTKESLSKYHANIAFISAAGIDINGISNTNELVVETERAMIENADKVVVIADASKLGQSAMCKVCQLNDIDILISTVIEDDDFKKQLELNKVDLIIA
ncbi:MAG: DeoR/GlpR family DNA-binding transcription regulator [Victivallales bacterium]|nr:DeoR/GlpR family DNA-binding transcription regulator [Victivallales bacterium]